MEYWIQLHIEQNNAVDDVVNDTHDVIDNWMQQDSPMLAEIPEAQLQPQKNTKQTHRVDRLKFGQDEDGYFLQASHGDIRLNNGDHIYFAGLVIAVTITKCQKARRSIIPQDFISSDIEAFHQQQQSTRSIAALQQHFSAPTLSDSESGMMYDDMQQRKTPKPDQTPLDGLDEFFHQAFERPFETQVPLHQRQPLTGAKEQGSVSKLKKLLWGDQHD